MSAGGGASAAEVSKLVLKDLTSSGVFSVANGYGPHAQELSVFDLNQIEKKAVQIHFRSSPTKTVVFSSRENVSLKICFILKIYKVSWNEIVSYLALFRNLSHFD